MRLQCVGAFNVAKGDLQGSFHLVSLVFRVVNTPACADP
jgi:hypothetical protein